MKFEALYFREKTVESYGKRGTSWHGAMITYYSWNQEENVADPQRIYRDDLIAETNKQGSGAVFSLIEGLLIRIARDLPFIEELILQSDNAKCYLGKELLVCFGILSYVHKVKIIRFVRTETQDGKSPLDGHFARAQEWIRNWILLNNNALTAAQIVTGLRSNGGMPNSISQLVELDMDKSRQFSLF